MASDMFLKLTGIPGESPDARHRDEIEVLAWRWEVTQPSTMHQGSGGGAGKATVADLVFEHYMDKSSPNLLKYCLTGKTIESAVLVLRKAGGTPLEYLKLTLNQVIVTKVAPGSGEGMHAPREVVGLSFTSLRQEYVIQNAQGGSGGTVGVGFDIKANKEN